MPDGLAGRSSPRVLMTTDAVGGVWRYSVELAQGFAALGAETVLAVMGPAASEGQRREADGVPGLRLVQTGLPLDWTAGSAGALRRASAGLRGLAALTGAVSVHLHAPALVGDAPWPAPVVAVAHSCVATWWRQARGGDMPADFAWRTEAAAVGLRRAAAVIAPSRAHADALRHVYGPLDLHVVHNGRRPLPAGAGPRARAVLTAGRLWDEGKRAAWLDRAAAGLDAPVRAAGPVEGPGGAASAFAHLDLLGTLDEPALADALAGARVFASVPAYEPFGLAVLEAAQAGMALVLSDIPTFRELWDGAALFVPDEAALLPALRRALDAPAPLGAAARERAGRTTAAAMAEATLALHARVRERA